MSRDSKKEEGEGKSERITGKDVRRREKSIRKHGTKRENFELNQQQVNIGSIQFRRGKISLFVDGILDFRSFFFSFPLPLYPLLFFLLSSSPIECTNSSRKWFERKEKFTWQKNEKL
jgi:hypothetical protein